MGWFLLDEGPAPRPCCSSVLERRGDGLVNTSRYRAVLCGVVIVISTIVFAAVLAGCAEARDESAAWVLVASSPDSSTIRIKAGFGGCSTFLRTNLKESVRSVGIDVIVHTTGDSCKAILRQLLPLRGGRASTERIHQRLTRPNLGSL